MSQRGGARSEGAFAPGAPERAGHAVTPPPHSPSGATPHAAAATSLPQGPSELSPARRRAFFAITLLIPVILLAAVEGALRLAHPDGGLPLFVPAAVEGGGYLVANPKVGERYFSGVGAAPAPPAEFFATPKPSNAFRLFVLGESTTAGFPSAQRHLLARARDALRDVLPHDSVEVINLGIAATNSVTLRDLAPEVADADPDAILIYAGHNEYYGVLGAAAARGGALAPLLVRATLQLQRLRIALALRSLLAPRATAATDSAPSFMEILARDREVPASSATYRRGERQFADNLSATIATFRRRGIPVFVGSLASNVRDRPPFASPNNRGADSAYRAGRVRSRQTTRRAHGERIPRHATPMSYASGHRPPSRRSCGRWPHRAARRTSRSRSDSTPRATACRANGSFSSMCTPRGPG